jgi:phosphatidylglycerol:prolipoprotein diacylglycerol transferase
MIFPQAAAEDRAAALVDPTLANLLSKYGGLPRNPSQLYQFGLEGVTLFVILWFFSRSARPTGLISAVFLIGYGSLRFIAEFARQPDDFLGLLAGRLSMGQWLSLPMIVLGSLIAIWAVRRPRC